jgi:hypothetical protein
MLFVRLTLTAAEVFSLSGISELSSDCLVAVETSLSSDDPLFDSNHSKKAFCK